MGKFNFNEDEFALSDQVLQQINNGDKNLTNIPVDCLILDPDNPIIFGEITQESIGALSTDVEEDGFKGTILAYPVEKKNGIQYYQIESGHKRYLAAKQAGLATVPVSITKPPKSDAERRLRLISMNLHGRNPKPSVQANMAKYLFESIKEMREEECLPVDVATLTAEVARRMEKSIKSIEKYKQFQKLIPELQKLADDGIPWSMLLNCTILSEEQQKMIAFQIRAEVNNIGIDKIDNISRQWLYNLIAQARNGAIGEDIEPVQPKNTVRRRDGAKIISKCAKDFEDILNNKAVIKNNNKEKAIEDLKNIREIIDKKLTELEED